MKHRKMVNTAIVILGLISIFILLQIIRAHTYERSQIDVVLLNEIEFENSIDKVLPDYMLYPKLHSGENYEMVYNNYLQTIFDLACISEDKADEIKAQISELPNGAYIYVCVGKKLKKIIYSDKPEQYGWSGVYSLDSYNSVFIYWGTEPLGNVVDGYV